MDVAQEECAEGRGDRSECNKRQITYTRNKLQNPSRTQTLTQSSRTTMHSLQWVFFPSFIRGADTFSKVYDSFLSPWQLFCVVTSHRHTLTLHWEMCRSLPKDQWKQKLTRTGWVLTPKQVLPATTRSHKQWTQMFAVLKTLSASHLPRVSGCLRSLRKVS